MRPVLNANEKIFTSFYGQENLSKEYPLETATKVPRVNGEVGMDVDFNPSDWKLEIISEMRGSIYLTLDEIKALPKTEIVFDFKCIEGWSQITHWGGVKLSELLSHYDLDQEMTMNYIGMVTPDEGYYVGIDMPSALHPQTLLCYEMNSAPLPVAHGHPLRLIIPVKYGIKHLKRVGSIYFSKERPPDYWAERGYDYYSGL